MKGVTYHKCLCVTRWLVDFGGKRGERPVPAISAAMASGVGLPVRLASISSSPFRQITPLVNVHYQGASHYIAKACEVCGAPTKLVKEAAPC